MANTSFETMRKEEWAKIGVMTPAKFAFLFCNEDCLLSGSAERTEAWTLMSEGREYQIEASALEMVAKLLDLAKSGKKHYILAGQFQLIEM